MEWSDIVWFNYGVYKGFNSLHVTGTFMCPRKRSCATQRAHLCAIWPYMQYWLYIKEVRVNPCQLSSNKSRPHLSTYMYVYLNKGRKQFVLGKRAVLVREWSWIWPWDTKHEATWEANGLQFSFKVWALPLDNLEVSWICQGCMYQAPFWIVVSHDVKGQILASNKYKLLT